MTFKNFDLNKYINSITPKNNLQINLSKLYQTSDLDIPHYSYSIFITTRDYYFYSINICKYYFSTSTTHLYSTSKLLDNLTLNQLYDEIDKLKNYPEFSNQNYLINEFYN